MVRTKISNEASDGEKKLLKEKGSLEGRCVWEGRDGREFVCATVDDRFFLILLHIQVSSSVQHASR